MKEKNQKRSSDVIPNPNYLDEHQISRNMEEQHKIFVHNNGKYNLPIMSVFGQALNALFLEQNEVIYLSQYLLGTLIPLLIEIDTQSKKLFHIYLNDIRINRQEYQTAMQSQDIRAIEKQAITTYLEAQNMVMREVIYTQDINDIVFEKNDQ